jgi:uncharacterized protein (TIGR03067 family)
MRTNGMRWIGCAAAVLLASVAGARGGDADEADLKKLEGTWTVAAGDGGEVVYTFKGKSLEIKAPSRSYKMTIKLDPAALPDKTIDFQIDEGPDDAKGRTSKGIYKFDGDDKFIFCMRPMGERPTKFEMVGFEQILSELKRKK